MTAEKKLQEENIIDEIESNVESGLEVIEEVSEDLDVKSKKKASKKSKKGDKGLEKEAEKISLETEKGDIESRKKALLEKAAKLKEKASTDMLSSEELKEQIKIKKREDMLLPLEEYVKAGIYIGTRVVTPDMRPYVYRRRADGLAIFNTDLIDEKLKEGIEYLSKFNPEDIILVCKRQAGWKAAELFSQMTGINVFTKKYPAGILTNIKLENFFENELTIVCDAWLDRNALEDTLRVKKNVMMVCDTNNFSKGANQIVIGNNKSPRSLGVIFYLLAKGYCKAKGINANIPDLEWWTGEREDSQKGAKMGV
jgi:small subunit ribosomal protein S2